jgi:hypothetical protein
VRVLHVHERTAAKVDTERNTVPKRDGKKTGYAEDQREGKEIPLFPEKIDVCISKEFHAAYDPFKIIFGQGTASAVPPP